MWPWHDEEVTGRGAIHVVRQERPPSLRWGTRSGVDHVLSDRGFGNLVAEQSQLSLDARCAPEAILAGHALNQGTNCGIDLRPTTVFGLPTPVQLEPASVPAHDGVRLDEDEGRAPTTPQPGDPDPEDAVSSAKAGTLCRAADDGQLLSKGQILGDQRGAVGKQHSSNDADDVGRLHSVPRLVTEPGILLKDVETGRAQVKVV